MKLFIVDHLNGHTFGILYANGNMAKYVGKTDKDGKPTAFATQAGAKKAGEKFESLKGPNWEHGNINYKSNSIVDGKLVEKVEFIHLPATY